ncbi:MAG: hypothetical protein ACC631_03795 [Halocynthiibacter sp.]
MSDTSAKPLGAAKAKLVENLIIGMGLLALFLIFQPFSIVLFGFGCALVVFSGLANNLLPLCKPENTWRDLGRTVLIILIVFAVVLIFALSSAYLYGVYLQSQ